MIGLYRRVKVLEELVEDIRTAYTAGYDYGIDCRRQRRNGIEPLPDGYDLTIGRGMTILESNAYNLGYEDAMNDNPRRNPI